MKRILFTMVIACAAVTGSVRAEIWGRTIPYSFASTTQDKVEELSTETQGPVAHGPAVQAPSTGPIQNQIQKGHIQGPIQSPIQGHVQAPIQGDGYPFSDRCGSAHSTCCDNVWAGYARPACRGLFAHHGCGKCGHGKLGLGLHGLHAGGCNDCGCSACDSGGCFNSFAGGGSCNGGGFGHGLGLHGGLLHGLGCGCGHKLGHLRRLCGLDCGCETVVGTTGCGCGSTGSPVQAHGKMMTPPVPSVEPTPAAETLTPSLEAGEKAAFRTNGWFPRAGF